MGPVSLTGRCRMLCMSKVHIANLSSARLLALSVFSQFLHDFFAWHAPHMLPFYMYHLWYNFCAHTAQWSLRETKNERLYSEQNMVRYIFFWWYTDILFNRTICKCPEWWQIFTEKWNKCSIHFSRWLTWHLSIIDYYQLDSSGFP